MTLNRVVVILTPVFTIGAGYVTTKLGLPEADQTALSTIASVAAASAALKWLHGHQKYEAFLNRLTEGEQWLAYENSSRAPTSKESNSPGGSSPSSASNAPSNTSTPNAAPA